MKIINNFSEFPKTEQSVVLSIGNFDGMHLGHQMLLQNLLSYSKDQGLDSVLLTFSNHPSTVLAPQKPTLQVCSLSHKLHLLEQSNVDWVILQSFTPEFASQTAEQFLTTLKKYVPFSYLILGNDAVMGKDRQGNPKAIQALGQKLDFTPTYLPTYCTGNIKISSSQIRALIGQGKLDEAAKLLGRRYSIYGHAKNGDDEDKSLGFHTANFDVQGLCLPPLGVYAVKVIHKGVEYSGVANLGLGSILKVYLFESPVNTLHEAPFEVIFLSFIRKEQKFSSVEEQKKQIVYDFYQAKIINQKGL